MRRPRPHPTLALAGFLACAGACGGEPPRPAPPPAISAGFAEGFSFEAPDSKPTGEPFDLSRHPPRTATRTTGRFTYVQVARGEFGATGRIPGRAFEAALAAVRRADGDGPGRRVTVEGTIDARETMTPGSTVARRAPFRLVLVEGPRGGAERKHVRLEAPPEWADVLENVTALWTEPLPLPDRPVRAGERFDLEGVVDLEPLQRAGWSVFRARDLTLPQVIVPIVGAAWVASREGEGAAGAAVLRTRLRQTAMAPLDVPATPSPRTVAYAAALDRERRVTLADGVTRRYDSTLRTRLRYAGGGADYGVDVEQRATLETADGE